MGLVGCFSIEKWKFIGFIGMNDVDKTTFPAHFTPAVEVGWRLDYLLDFFRN